jgi:hypothetical protein
MDLNGEPVKAFVRNKETQLYRAAAKGWVTASGQALGLTIVTQATKFALEPKVPQAEIVVRFEFHPHEFVVPVLPEYRDVDQRNATAAKNPGADSS